MTFVLGLKCADGLVMCADRLESDGVTKSYRNKLSFQSSGNDWGICCGASGNGYTCDKFADKMEQILKEKPYNRASIETDVETCLEFIRQSYAAEHQITIVAGLYGRTMQKEIGPWEFHLYRGSSGSGCLSPIRDYACAGMDVTLAGFTLSNIFHRWMPVEHGKQLAVFVTALMKEHADGVGGPSDCFYHIVGAPTWEPVLDREIVELESKFSTTSFNEAVTRYWLEFHENRNLKEFTGSELNTKRATAYMTEMIASRERRSKNGSS